MHRRLAPDPDTSPPALDPPPAGMVVTSINNRTLFGLLATDTLPDLCATGTNQPARFIPKRRS